MIPGWDSFDAALSLFHFEHVIPGWDSFDAALSLFQINTSLTSSFFFGRTYQSTNSARNVVTRRFDQS